MKTDKLKELIENSDLDQIQKNMSLGFILRAEENNNEREEDRDLIEKTANCKNLQTVHISTGEVKIYSVYGKDEWDIKYPYRSIYFKDGKWYRVNTTSPSIDTAYICYLEYKYLDANSRFKDFALKMLEIKIEQ